MLSGTSMLHEGHHQSRAMLEPTHTQLYQIVSGGKELFSKKNNNNKKKKKKRKKKEEATVLVMCNQHWLEMIASDVFVDSLPTFNKILVNKHGSF